MTSTKSNTVTDIQSTAKTTASSTTVSTGIMASLSTPTLLSVTSKTVSISTNPSTVSTSDSKLLSTTVKSKTARASTVTTTSTKTSTFAPVPVPREKRLSPLSENRRKAIPANKQPQDDLDKATKTESEVTECETNLSSNTTTDNDHSVPQALKNETNSVPTFGVAVSEHDGSLYETHASHQSLPADISTRKSPPTGLTFASQSTDHYRLESVDGDMEWNDLGAESDGETQEQDLECKWHERG